MLELNTVLRTLQIQYPNCKKTYPGINEQILKSAIVYKILYQFYLRDRISIPEILEMYDGEIGLIGPSNGRCTHFLEKLFGGFDCCHMHSCFHDAYGRFYQRYKRSNGYLYVFDGNWVPSWAKSSPLLGHISGFVWCMKNSQRFNF